VAVIVFMVGANLYRDVVADTIVLSALLSTHNIHSSTSSSN